MTLERPSDRKAKRAEALLAAYGTGIFPMAATRDDPQLHWIDPARRGVMPLDGLHVSRSLRRRLRQQPFEITINRDFDGVLDGCADRDDTWINAPIREMMISLHLMGHAHSLEVREGLHLIGGIYGITLGAAFFGESMFSRRRDASKIALVYLVDRLRERGFTLFDTQFITPHLRSMGGVEISRAEYRRQLRAAIKGAAEFDSQPKSPPVQEILQRNTQTSKRA